MAVLSDFIPVANNDSQQDLTSVDKASDFKLPAIDNNQGLGVQQPKLDDFMKGSFDTALSPETFDWDKEGMGKFAGSRHIKELGADPYLGQGFNENRFAQAQTNWDVFSRTVGGAGAGLWHGFWDQLSSWKNIASTFSNIPNLGAGYTQDQYEELNKKS